MNNNNDLNDAIKFFALVLVIAVFCALISASFLFTDAEIAAMLGVK